MLYQEWEEPDQNPLRLDQPTDKQDPRYRPYQVTRRRKGSGTAYHRTKSRGRGVGPTCGRLMKLSQDPTKEQESEPKAKIGKKMRRSWFPTTVLFLYLWTLTSGAGQANTSQIRRSGGAASIVDQHWSSAGSCPLERQDERYPSQRREIRRHLLPTLGSG